VALFERKLPRFYCGPFRARRGERSPPGGRRGMRRPAPGGWRAHLAVLGGYLLLSLAFTWPLVLHIGSAIPGDGFDGLQNYWNLWWVRHALLDLQTTPFFTNLLFYPTGASLYFHTLNIFNGLWSLPVQLLSVVAVSYNVVFCFTFVLS